DLPRAARLDLVLQHTLPRDELVHLVRIIEHVLIGELVVHLLVLLQQVHDGLHTLAHDLDHGLVLVQHGLLLQVADGVLRGEVHIALEVGLLAGDDPHQRGFTAAVQAEDADLGSIVEAEVDVLENGLSVGQRLAHLDHVVNDLTSFFCHCRGGCGRPQRRYRTAKMPKRGRSSTSWAVVAPVVSAWWCSRMSPTSKPVSHGTATKRRPPCCRWCSMPRSMPAATAWNSIGASQGNFMYRRSPGSIALRR